MPDFEERLKEAMARETPPEGFEARVLAAVRETQGAGSEKQRGWWTPWRLLAALKPALLASLKPALLAPVLAALLVLSVGFIYQKHEHTVRGEAAKAKLLVAMRVAGSKLHETRDRVSEMGAMEREQWDKTSHAY
jgi:hypothetical protein